nr:hypothetical protein CFP56_60767 [Quercus suber]
MNSNMHRFLSRREKKSDSKVCRSCFLTLYSLLLQGTSYTCMINDRIMPWRWLRGSDVKEHRRTTTSSSETSDAQTMPVALRKIKRWASENTLHALLFPLQQNSTSLVLIDTVPQTVNPPDHFGGVFASESDPRKKPDKEEEKTIKGILERLRHYGIDAMVEANAEYALRAPGIDGDAEAAFKLLILLQDTFEGIVKPYNPDIQLKGAQNRESVTCFLDALLFAMFARLDSFEALLYDSLQDLPRKKLAGILRLWVNMLRDGRLITVDITKRIQEALAECGWQEASKLKQQDPSEAFTFITGQLELPLLTLKMDLYHTGKEDPQDDHKFVNERLLEVAIADQPQDGEDIITLEACLQQYFNNRIEVKRHIENMRRNTLKSVTEAEIQEKRVLEAEENSDTHIEVLEIDAPETPLAESPRTSGFPSQIKDPVAKLRPGMVRSRADSIFSQRQIALDNVEPDFKGTTDDRNRLMDSQSRKLSLRTEVLMPAWQFFKLLP